ncbi:MAG: ABC transporter ATP-binding protein [Polyangiaceae bacterium]
MSALAHDLNAHALTLRVRDLSLQFETRGGVVSALEGVSFDVEPGENVGLVGESGSGKSVACLAILGLLDKNARVTGGSVCLGERVVLAPGQPPLAAPELAMIFQYPRTALNPVRTIGAQLVDVLATSERGSHKKLEQRALELLTEVQIARAHERLKAYPFELSGGQCQRVLIAMALARRPRLLLADEPTTGLDVVTQRGVMDLLAAARASHGMSTILVTHDLGLAREFCDRVYVMQRGRVLESGPSASLFRAARHPYTRALLGATPALTRDLTELRAAIGGDDHE